MNILIIGGTRFFGRHLIAELLKQGHSVTIATRGLMPDNFGDNRNLNRVRVDRCDYSAMKTTFKDKSYDVVIDDIAYSSNDVKSALDNIKCGRYILVSSVSVYCNEHLELGEDEFNPLKHELKWCVRNDYPYDEVKRQAEAALFQSYGDVPSCAVRFPYVIGKDDYTRRLFFYADSIAGEKEIFIDNISSEQAFINSDEAGRFLAFLAESQLTGIFNAASSGTVSIGELVEYIEKKVGKSLKNVPDGEAAPYNGGLSYSLNTSRAESYGWKPEKLRDYFFKLIDSYLEEIKG